MGVYYIVSRRMLQIFIFYITLQTVSSAIEYGYDRELDEAPGLASYREDREKRFNNLLSNIQGLFKRKMNTDLQNSDFNKEPLINQKPGDRKHIEEVISEVTKTLDKIKDELIKFNKDGVVTIELPVTGKVNRKKRDVSNNTVSTALRTVDNGSERIETTTGNNTDVTEKEPEKVTEAPATVKEAARTINDTENTVSGRRMMAEVVSINSRIKNKLLLYLEDTFREIEKKIKPLTNVKIALSNNDHYKVGYIMATIDTLDVNMKKLKLDMNMHQRQWDDEKVLNLFDRIKATNSVTATLIETLKKYLPKK